jgi:serine carboxypeptidase 1
VATTDAEVTADLLSFLKDLFGTISTLQKRPLFIVGESYGGKHASMIGLALSKAIAAGDMKVNLGGKSI